MGDRICSLNYGSQMYTFLTAEVGRFVQKFESATLVS
jgi:hypothetical protein